LRRPRGSFEIKEHNMTMKLPRSLLPALAVGVVLAGCGSASNSTSTSQTASSAAASTAAPTSSSAATSTGTSSTSAPATPSAAVVQALAAQCQSVIARAPNLPASTKGKVEGICKKASSGDVAGARAAAKEVCVEVINAVPLPPGISKQAALLACKVK
jgi:uncharacterized protein YceK